MQILQLLLTLTACAHVRGDDGRPVRREEDLPGELRRLAQKEAHIGCPLNCKLDMLWRYYHESEDPELRGEVLLRIVELQEDVARELQLVGEGPRSQEYRMGAALAGARLLRELPETRAAARYRAWIEEGLLPEPAAAPF